MEPIKVSVNSIEDISPLKLKYIDELTICQNFGTSHIGILRSMCNCLVEGKRTGGRLSKIIFEADVDIKNTDYFTDCITLKQIVFYRPIQLGAEYFSNCINLENIVTGKFKSFGCTWLTEEGVVYCENDKDKTRRLVKYPANCGNEFVVKRNVTNINGYAFENSHLGTLIMEPTTPPSCNADAFDGVETRAITLKIPKGSFNSFFTHKVWGEFNIEEM